jgi:expansin (peptidoglycan-binding protein)
MLYFISILLSISTIALADIDYDVGITTGRITYYDQSSGIVACDIPQSEWPPYTAALDETHFQGGLACGAYAHLNKNGNEIEVMIVDLCPIQGNEQWCSGDVTHFDLGGASTFDMLEPHVTGVTDVEFEWIPTPVGDSPIKLRYMTGINQWWVTIGVINHRYPIANLEILDPISETWIAGDRTNPGIWNYWQFDFPSGLTTPFQIRITDQYGQVIEETASVIEESYMWTGQNQFPLLERHGGATGSQDRKAVLPIARARIAQGILKLGDIPAETVDVYNVSGQRLFCLVIESGQQHVNLPEVETGLYHIRIQASGSLYTLRWFAD